MKLLVRCRPQSQKLQQSESSSRTASNTQNMTANISLRIRSAVDRHGQSRTARRPSARRSDRKIVLPAEQQHTPLHRNQNAHFPPRRGKAGEEQEGSRASVEPRVSIEYMLL